jgi:hypothetical protein
MIPTRIESVDLLEHTDFFRLDVSRRLDPKRRSEMGQFFTPAPTARLMASMFENRLPSLHLLDAGAGVGSLSAAWVADVCGRARKPKAVSVTAYEVEAQFIDYLTDTLTACEKLRADGWAIQGANKVPDLGPAKEHIKFALLARCDSVRRSLLTSARHGS